MSMTTALAALAAMAIVAYLVYSLLWPERF
jgi:K+-transporting ATPase KdpF subunit